MSRRLLAALLLASGCSRGQVVARVDGEPVLRRDLDARASAALTRLRFEEHDALRASLDEMIAERLVDREAARRGLSRADFLRAEVDDRVPPPPAAEVEAALGRLPPEAAARPGIRDEIERRLRERAVEARRAEYLASLRQAARVSIDLPAPRATLRTLAGDRTRGNAAAPVTIVEYLDYQCGYCRRAEGVVNEILERHGKDVRFVVRDYLISADHLPAARAARCAGDQGRLWEMHRELFAEPTDLSTADLAARAAKLGLDAAAFSACVESDRHDSAIVGDHETGRALGIEGTPTFFVNGMRLQGSPSREDLEDLIRRESAGPRG